MARHAIDLSQPLSRESQLHPFFAPTQIMRHIQHTDAAEGDPSFAAELIITSNHAATHVDAFAHYDSSPDAPLIADMPLDTFWGARSSSTSGSTSAGTTSPPPRSSGRSRPAARSCARDDILVFCSDHYNRTAGTPAFLDGFAGISAEAVHWMADRQVKIFGVETISPDLVYLTDRYPCHRACAERGVTHYENLNNLKDVVNQRIEFFGFPLRLVPAAGSPVRAVGDRRRLTARGPALSCRAPHGAFALRSRRPVRPGRRGDGAARARAADRRAVPDPARRSAGWRLGFDPGHPGDSRFRPRPCSSASCRRSSTRRRSSPRCATCAPTRGRSACSPSGWSSSPSRASRVVAHALLDLSLAGGVRARRRRLADRSHRGDLDRQPPRPPAPHRRDRRGREPRQRRHRARGLQVRGRRRWSAARSACSSSSLSFVWTIGGGIAIGLGRRLGAARGAAAPEQPAGRDHDRAASRAGSPTCRPSSPAPRACSPSSPPASTSAGTRPS